MTPKHLLLLLLFGCGEDTTAPMNIATTGDGGDEDADAPEVLGPCPPEMVALPAGVVTLGETDPDLLATYQEDGQITVLPEFTATVGAVCVSVYPFPGRFGDPWPDDGLRYGQLAALEEALAPTGRRLCTVAELTLAAAGPSNWRYPYDPEEHVDGVCDPDDGSPADMGSYRDCESTLQAHDFMVRSTWATLDDATHDLLLPYYSNRLPEEGWYAIYGGVSRLDTFYAPSNFGVHFHGADEDAYKDDGLRLCADVDAVGKKEQKAWKKALGQYDEGRSFAAWLGD